MEHNQKEGLSLRKWQDSPDDKKENRKEAATFSVQSYIYDWGWSTHKGNKQRMRGFFASETSTASDTIRRYSGRVGSTGLL